MVIRHSFIMKFSTNRCKTVGRRLKTSARNYCKETSLHGLRYITSPKSSKIKSYLWGGICLTSFSLCMILIYSQISVYYSNRITTTILTTNFPIWEVPFPAVTLCSFNPVYKKNVEGLKELLLLWLSNCCRFGEDFAPKLVDGFFGNLSFLIDPTRCCENNTDWQVYNPILTFLYSNGYQMDSLMRMLALPCNELLTNCYWKNNKIDCDSVFRLIRTNRGYCCSFNYQGETERRVVNSSSIRSIRVQGIGPSFGLRVEINPQSSQHVSGTKQGLAGVNVVIHDNTEYPDINLHGNTVYMGNDVSFAMKPEVLESNKVLRNVDILTRDCVFDDEIDMEWSKTYNYPTCIAECVAHGYLKLCGCVPYYYPLDRHKARYCTLQDLPCLSKQRINFGSSIAFRKSPGRYNIHGCSKSHSTTDSVNCHCYPSCNEITYSYQLDEEVIGEQNTQSNISIVKVYFNNISCTKIGRNIFLTWELILVLITRAFAASIGGLIGLCLGGSILSVIEVLYHIFDAIFLKHPASKKQSERKPFQLKLYINEINSGARVRPFSVPPETDKF